MAATFNYTRFTGEDKAGIFLVNHLEDLSAASCDIICVHGLHGGAAKTWRHPDTEVNWLEELLPACILRHFGRSGARIWSYGYPASVWMQDYNLRGHAGNLLSSVKDIRRGHEDKKIIWICYSLGGILVKQALVDAKINTLFRSIGTNTVGIVFLGTPHSGTGVATLASIAMSIVGSAMPTIWMNRTAVKGLKKNGDNLFTLAGQFVNAYSDVTIHTFHETRPLNGTLVVSQQSAVLQTPNEVKAYAMHADHRSMVKFRNSNDPNWVPVQNSLCELVELALAASRQGPRTWPPSPVSSTAPSPAPPRQQSMPSPGYQQPRSSYHHQSYGSSVQSSPEIPQSHFGNHNPYRQAPSTSQTSFDSATSRRTAPQPQYQQRPPPGTATPVGDRQRSSYSSFSSQHSRLNLRGDYVSSPSSVPSNSAARTSAAASMAYAPSHSVLGGRVVEIDDDDDRLGAYCDIIGCAAPNTQRPIKLSEVRVKCNVCDDYDLCLSCYQSEKANKGHRPEHSVCIIKRTRLISPEDLNQPSEVVNPQVSNPQNPARLSWVCSEIQDSETGESKTVKHLRLFGNNSHARFLLDLKPGHYIVELKLKFEFYDKCGQQALDVIRQGGAGSMRASMGMAVSQRDFRRGQYAEDSISSTIQRAGPLPSRLLRNAVSKTFPVPKGDVLYQVNFNQLMHVTAADADIYVDVGLVLQWSQVPQFSPTDPDAVVQVYVDEIRLFDVLNHEEPISRPAPNNNPQQIGSAKQANPRASTTAASSNSNTGDDDDDDDDGTLTPEQYVALVLHAAQELHDEAEKRQLMALIQQRLQEREQEARRQQIIRAIQAAVQEKQREEAEKIEAARATAMLALLMGGMRFE